MPKTDLKKELKHLYTASAKRATLIEVPKLKFLMVDGSGDPNANPLFQQAMEALYSVAYTLKFTLKLGPEKLDWAMLAPEGLWWTEGPEPFDVADKASWKWTLMIALPEFVSAAMVRATKKKVKAKKPLARVDDVRLEAFREGPSVQILHLGPYSEEGPTLEKLDQFAAENGYALTGKHHEIYFSDPRRTKPEKWRTILRQPVRKAG
jgi:hypothetical protein